ALEALEQVGGGKEEERAQGLLGDGQAVAGARIDAHGPAGGLEGDEAPGAGVTEQQRVVVEGQRERGQFSMPRRRWSSRRWARWPGSMATARSSPAMASRTLC